MTKPTIVPLTFDIVEPFIRDYCNRWSVQYERDEEYGSQVLWMGALYKNAVRAVAGLMVPGGLEDELFVYGFFGDGTAQQARPLRSLMTFIDDLPYKHKHGYIRVDNLEMLRAARRDGWNVEMENLPTPSHGPVHLVGR